jgi:flagellar P-ring protein FlgI
MRSQRAIARAAGLAALVLTALVPAGPLVAQEVAIRDLASANQTVPIRLMGYGLVVGLDGSGDRALGGPDGSHTVQSVVNLLRRFDIEVPAGAIRMRNVAAVLVTAEIDPFLRPGGRFTVRVSSLGDARSLRGGVLWMTPLVADAGGAAVAAAQGALWLGDQTGSGRRGAYVVETTATVPDGGVVEAEQQRPEFAATSRLLLRTPDLGTAVRIAQVINTELGAGSATAEDPGSVTIRLPADDGITVLSRIMELRVRPETASRLVISAREGTIVGGGDIVVGPAVVSHGAITLSIGGAGVGTPELGDVRMPGGSTVQEIAAALHAVQAPASEISAIFQALREVGAIRAELVVR